MDRVFRTVGRPFCTFRRPLRFALLMGVAGALAGCDEGAQMPGLFQSKDKPAAAAPAQDTRTKLVERDVEAPEVFQVTEAGLWDGRPSLGGVWVAHPDVQEPERVIIRNNANGKFVIGALFRRERAIPGPRIQASSDAAAALGMLAGSPVELNVTALRRETVDPEPDPEAAKDSAEAPEAPAAVEESTLDPIAGAAAAIEAADAPAEADKTAGATEDEAAKKPRSNLFSRLIGKRAAKEDSAPAEAATASPAEEPAAAPAAAEKPVAKPAAKPKASTLEKPYIQIGIFSVKANAERTANQMRGVGMVPTVLEQELNGKQFWRVVVGPARNNSERSALLKKVKETGFSDAYAVTN